MVKQKLVEELFWWLFNMLFGGFRQEAGWMTSISSLAAYKKGCTGCRTDTVVCLMTFGCPLRPVHRESKATLRSHDSNSQISLLHRETGHSKSPFSDRFGTKRRKVQASHKTSLESHLSTITIQQTRSTVSQALVKMPRIQQWKKEPKSCPQEASVLVKLTPRWARCLIFRASLLPLIHIYLLLTPRQATGT